MADVDVLRDIMYLFGIIFLLNSPIVLLRNYLEKIKTNWEKSRKDVKDLTIEISVSFSEKLSVFFEELNEKQSNDENLEVYDVLNPKVEDLCRTFIKNRELGSIVDSSIDNIDKWQVHTWLILVFYDLFLFSTIVISLTQIDLNWLFDWPFSLLISVFPFTIIILLIYCGFIFYKTRKREEKRRELEKQHHKTNLYEFKIKE